MQRLLAATLVASAVPAGCATKYYGRANELTTYEKNSLSCPEIDIEMVWVDDFQRRIAGQDHFDGRSALSPATDFGIGNAMERDAANKSANNRRHQLDDLRVEKGCGDRTTVPVMPAPASSTEQPHGPSASIHRSGRENRDTV